MGLHIQMLLYYLCSDLILFFLLDWFSIFNFIKSVSAKLSPVKSNLLITGNDEESNTKKNEPSDDITTSLGLIRQLLLSHPCIEFSVCEYEGSEINKIKLINKAKLVISLLILGIMAVNFNLGSLIISYN